MEVRVSKLRDDLVGVVFVDGRPFGAGAVVPDGAVVAESLLAPVEMAPAPGPDRKPAARRGRPRKGS